MNIFSKTILKFAILGLLFLVFSCKDSSNSNGCDNFPLVSESVDINGTIYNLSFAEYIGSNFVVEYEHSFEIDGVNSDCSVTKEFYFKVINSNNSPVGTYPIFSTNSNPKNAVVGTITSTKFSPFSISILGMKSGEMDIKEIKYKKFDINLRAILDDSSNLSLKFTHQF